MRFRSACLLGFCMVFTGITQASVYNTPAHLINIPIVETYEMGRIEYGSSVSYHDNRNFEFDFMVNYALLDRVILGVTMLESDQLVLNTHWNIFNLKYFGMATGIQNITKDKSPDTWKGNDMTSETAYSPYIVSRIGLGPYINFHFGYGDNRFKSGNPGRGETTGAEGMFYGLDVTIAAIKVQAEYDGRDTNIGFSVPMTKYAELNVAFTELFLAGAQNQNYDNAPVRNFALGIKFHRNLLSLKRERLAELNDQMTLLQTKYSELDKLHYEMRLELERMKDERQSFTEDVNRLKTAIRDETKFLYERDKEKKEDLRKKYLGVNQEIGEKVISLYYESFEYYYQKEYNKAIELLQKALVLDPYMPQLYMRMGSIYYELDMTKEAYESYMRAYELDPHNEELQQLLSRFE